MSIDAGVSFGSIWPSIRQAYERRAASAIETGTAKTEGLGPQDESAAPKVDAQPLVKGETNHG